MSELPKSYTDATSVEGLAELYREQPDEAHNILRRNTVQELFTRTITVHQACQSSYFPHTLPTEIRKSKRLIPNRRKMKKMLSFFTESRRVWTITELDLWHWYLHVSFDFETTNFHPGIISSKEMEDNKHIRMHFDSATLKSLRRMVHDIQRTLPHQETVVLPTFNKQWRKHESFDVSDWDQAEHPLNTFLTQHQDQPIFGDFYIGLFAGRLASYENSNREQLLADFRREKGAKKNKARRSKASMTLNPLGLLPCDVVKNGWRFR